MMSSTIAAHVRERQYRNRGPVGEGEGRLRRLCAGAGCYCGFRPIQFLYQSDEPEALARQRLDETLFLAGIADHASSDIQAGCEGRIRHDTPIPNGIDEVVLADDALPVPDQIIEQVENLGRNGNGFRAAVQLAPVSIE